MKCTTSHIDSRCFNIFIKRHIVSCTYSKTIVIRRTMTNVSETTILICKDIKPCDTPFISNACPSPAAVINGILFRLFSNRNALSTVPNVKPLKVFLRLPLVRRINPNCIYKVTLLLLIGHLKPYKIVHMQLVHSQKYQRKYTRYSCCNPMGCEGNRVSNNLSICYFRS